MSVIALPTGFDFATEGWRLFVPGQRNRSPWTSRSKFVGLPGAEMWTARVTIEPLTTEDMEREWRAFMIDMGGQQNSVYLQANCQVTPNATATVGSGSTDGYTLPIADLALSQTILKRGDMMTVALPSSHKRLVMLTADLVSNGSGNATAQFKPALNEVPTLGATVTLDKPFCPMTFDDATQGWDRADAITTISLTCTEAL